jgi:hypothetical protein
MLLNPNILKCREKRAFKLWLYRCSAACLKKCELERQPVLNFITILALKYFNRLKQLPSDRLLGEVYEVDKSLFIDGHRSWQKFIHNSLVLYKKSASFSDGNSLESSKFG